MKKEIDYKKSVIHGLKRIGHSHRTKLINQIEKELAENAFAGKQLHGNYTGLLSYCCRYYRIIYTIIHESVLILRISHRKDVYR